MEPAGIESNALTYNQLISELLNNELGKKKESISPAILKIFESLEYNQAKELCQEIKKINNASDFEIIEATLNSNQDQEPAKICKKIIDKINNARVSELGAFSLGRYDTTVFSNFGPYLRTVINPKLNEMLDISIRQGGYNGFQSNDNQPLVDQSEFFNAKVLNEVNSLTDKEKVYLMMYFRHFPDLVKSILNDKELKFEEFYVMNRYNFGAPCALLAYIFFECSEVELNSLLDHPNFIFDVPPGKEQGVAHDLEYFITQSRIENNKINSTTLRTFFHHPKIFESLSNNKSFINYVNQMPNNRGKVIIEQLIGG